MQRDDDEKLKADLQRAKELIETAADAVYAVLSSESGEIFLEWLALTSGANRPTFHPNPSVAAFREGRRSLALEIFQFKHMTPEQIFKLRERKYLR